MNLVRQGTGQDMGQSLAMDAPELETMLWLVLTRTMHSHARLWRSIPIFLNPLFLWTLELEQLCVLICQKSCRTL